MSKEKSMSYDEKLTRATIGSVVIVAIFAAIVSYVHIRSLGLRNGYDGFTASLLPLAVDGLIVGCGLMLARASRASLRATVARCGLWLGIGATIASNAAYGLPHGVVGAVVSALPAASFIAIVEAWMQLAKRISKTAPVKASEPVETAVKTVPVPPPAVPAKPAPAAKPSRPKAKKITKASAPRTAPQPEAIAAIQANGIPTAYKIAKTLNCGHNKSVELHDIMVSEGCDLLTADQIREDRKKVITNA